MTFTKKLLTTLIATVLLSTIFGATAFASELDTVNSLTEQSTTEASGDTLSSDNNIVTNTDDTLVQEVATGDNLDLLLEEGYYLDEQGELCYEEPDKEDTAVEDTEEAKDEEVATEKPSYSEKDLRLLACLVYSEAGNQNYNGMLGVANVVLNRAKSDVYGHVDTVEEVIYDNKWSVQFAVTIKGKSSGLSMLDKALKLYDSRKFTGSNPEAQKKAMNKAIKAAKAALQGNNNIGDYLCFQNKRSASSIKRKYSDYEIVDDHIFYRTK